MSLRLVSCSLVARPLGFTLAGVTSTGIMSHVVLMPAYVDISFLIAISDIVQPDTPYFTDVN